MSLTSYINYDEPRTVGLDMGRGQDRVKSIQAWKSKPTNTSVTDTAKNTSHNAPAAKTDFAKSIDEQMQNVAPAAGEPSAPINTTTLNSFKFTDIIDVVNPLHHIPIIGSLYRHFTDDKLHPMSGIIGGAVYGGPVGAVSGTVNAVSQIQTGKDIGEHSLNLIGFRQQESITQPAPLESKQAQDAYNAQSTGQSLQDKINELRQSGVTITAINDVKA